MRDDAGGGGHRNSKFSDVIHGRLFKTLVHKSILQTYADKTQTYEARNLHFIPFILIH
jgi:hypothetical protein